MDRQQIAVKLALEPLELKPKVESFDQRLILQKAIYLAQAKGVHLGYYFHWYLYGPYCPSLTKDLFAIESEGDYAEKECEKWKLDDQSLDRLKKLHEFLETIESADRARRLELLASVHFLVTHKQVPGKDSQKIQEVLKRYDKTFSVAQVKEALGDLDKYALLDN